MKSCTDCPHRITCKTPCQKIQKELWKVTKGRLKDGSVDTEIPFSRFTDYELSLLIENTNTPFSGNSWNFTVWKRKTKGMPEKEADVVFDYWINGVDIKEIINKYQITRDNIYNILRKVI